MKITKLSLQGLYLKKYIKNKKLKYRVSLIQLWPILGISLCGFSLSSCPQRSLTVSPLAPKCHVAFNFKFSIKLIVL
jgi:hypothetical protein